MTLNDSQVFNDPYRGMGTNLHENADWNPDVPWKDLMRQARRYIPQTPSFGTEWDTGETLTLDSNGWPQPTSSQAWATLICTDLGGKYPSGTYHLLFDGTQGQIFTFGAAKITATSTGDYTLEIDPEDGTIGLRFWPDEAGNYNLTNIRLVHEDDLATYQTQPFRDEYVTDLKDNFTTFRFMNWGRTNGDEGNGTANPTIAYTDIPDTSWATQTGPTGVSVELMVDLCNEANRNMWYCIPHQMSDAGVTAVAQYIRDNLEVNLRCFFELSNESAWNGGRYFDGVQYVPTGFPQCTYFWDIGNDFTAPSTIGAGALDSAQFTAMVKAYSVRMKEVMTLVDTAYSGQLSRRIRVAGSQWANAFVSSTVLEHGNAYEKIDALAVGAYFGASLGSPFNSVNWAEKIKQQYAVFLGQAGGSEEAALLETHEWLFRTMTSEIGREWRVLAAAHLAAITNLPADPNGIKLIAYEGGQHLAGVANYLFDPLLAKIFTTMNKRAEMGLLYKQAFEVWREAVGTNLFCHFLYTHEFNNFGSWGAKEYSLQSDAAAPPKWRELVKQAQAFFL